jgi:hypothetical protein
MIPGPFSISDAAVFEGNSGTECSVYREPVEQTQHPFSRFLTSRPALIEPLVDSLFFSRVAPPARRHVSGGDTLNEPDEVLLRDLSSQSVRPPPKASALSE